MIAPIKPTAAANAGTRVSIDYEIPLWALITCLGSGCLLIAGIYFNVQMLTSAMQELQTTVKTGNAAMIVVSSDNAMQNFRLGSIESDLSRLNEVVRQQQIKRAGK